MSTLADDFKALGMFGTEGMVLKVTCAVCGLKVEGEIPLEEFDFDETPENAAVRVAGVSACSGCWRGCLSDLAKALERLPTTVREAVLASTHGMEDLIESVVTSARAKWIRR